MIKLIFYEAKINSTQGQIGGDKGNRQATTPIVHVTSPKLKNLLF